MATLIWVNIGLGNGLLPDVTITWTNVDLSSMVYGIHSVFKREQSVHELNP